MYDLKHTERFLRQIWIAENGCWEWTGCLKSSGYGQVTVRSRPYAAHRFSWELSYNCAIPEGEVILHRCDNKKCVNPWHLEKGTQGDNMNDFAKKDLHPRKLPREVREKILLLRNQKYSQDHIAHKLGISQTTVHKYLKEGI